MLVKNPHIVTQSPVKLSDSFQSNSISLCLSPCILFYSTSSHRISFHVTHPVSAHRSHLSCSVSLSRPVLLCPALSHNIPSVSCLISFYPTCIFALFHCPDLSYPYHPILWLFLFILSSPTSLYPISSCNVLLYTYLCLFSSFHSIPLLLTLIYLILSCSTLFIPSKCCDGYAPHHPKSLCPISFSLILFRLFLTIPLKNSYNPPSHPFQSIKSRHLLSHLTLSNHVLFDVFSDVMVQQCPGIFSPAIDG